MRAKSKSAFFGLSTSANLDAEKTQKLSGSQLAANGSLTLISGDDITIAGSDLIANNNINISAFDELLITSAEETSQVESKSESGGLFSGGSLFSSSESMQGQETTTAYGSLVNAGGDINIDVGSATVVGSDLFATGSIGVATDIGEIQVLSAKESTETYSSERKIEVGFGDLLKGLTNPTDAIKVEDGQLKFSIANASYDKVDFSSTEIGHKGSTLAANGKVTLDSIADIQIEGSDLIAGAGSAAGSDATEEVQGDLNLLAGGNVTIKEAENSYEESLEETHGSADMSVVVQHQAVEVAKAVIAVKEAHEQVKQAEKDYRTYKKERDNLEGQLVQLEADYNSGVPGVNYADLIEMRELLEDVKSDEEWYVAGIALAAANTASKTTGLMQQTFAAANSAGTYGFNAGVQLDIEATQIQNEFEETTSQASNVSGNNINIFTGLNQDSADTGSSDISSTLIQGSHFNAQNSLNISTGELNVLASRDTSSSMSETQNGSLTIAQTVWGAAGGPTVSASYDRNQSKDKTTTYNNSTLTAADINITTSGDTRIEGGNLTADNGLNLDVGGDLLLESKQDRTSGSNKGFGVSGGFSFGGDTSKNTGKSASTSFNSVGDTSQGVSSVNGGLNASNGRYQNKETVLSSITGGKVNIDVAGNTSIVGALIASLNEEGKDNGQLNLSTGSLSFTDLGNTSFNTQQSMGLSTSVGLGSENTANPNESNTELTVNTSTLSYSNESSYDKSKTLATIGQGTVTIGGEEVGEEVGNSSTNDALAGLNRDTNNIDKEFYSVDRQQGNIDLMVDHRLLSEEGRKSIATDFVRTGDLGSDFVKAIDDTLAQNSDSPEDQQNLWENFVQRNATTNTIVEQAQSEEQQALLKGEGGAEGSLAGVNNLVDGLDANLGLTDTDALLYDGHQVDASTGMAGGYYQDDTDTVGVNIQKTDMTNSTSVVETVVHEYNHGLLEGGSGEAIAESRAQSAGEQWQSYSDIGGFDTQFSTSQTDWIAQNRDSSAVSSGTSTTQQASLSERHFRQPAVRELRLVESAAAGYAQENGISIDEARKALTQQMLLQIDEGWSEQNHITENPTARDALAAMGTGTEFSDINDVPGIDKQDTLFTAEGDDFENQYKNAENVSDGAYSTNHRDVETISTVNVDGNDVNYAEYLQQYGTADGTVTLPKAEDYATSIDNTIETGKEFVIAIVGSEDPLGLLTDAVSTGVSNCYDSGINCIADTEGTALDRLTIDVLQQDPVSAAGNDLAGITEFVGGIAGLGVGKVTGDAIKEGFGALTDALKDKDVGGNDWLTKDFGGDGLFDESVVVNYQLTTKFGPHEKGPLGDPNDPRAPASTFRSGTYTENIVETDLYLFRDYGGKANVDGRYWTPEQSSGPMQSQLDSAVLPEWGNSFQHQAVIKVPKGTKYYEGPAAPQKGTVGTQPELLGGGTQVFLPNPKKEWINNK